MIYMEVHIDFLIRFLKIWFKFIFSDLQDINQVSELITEKLK